MAATRSFRLVSALSAEPLNHIHAIPALIILSFSHPLQSPSKLFSTAFDSTPIAKFLLNDCGFSLEDANDICRRKPDLLSHGKSYDNSRQTLLFLRDKGFHEIGIQKLFSKLPSILRFSFQDNVKLKVEFLEKIGLTGQKLVKILSRDPRFLGFSISRTLEPRVCLLQSVLDPDQAIVVSNPASDKIPGSKFVSNHKRTLSVICLNPRILGLTTAKSLVLVKDVEGLGFEKGSKAFSRAFLQLSMLNRDNVKLKLESLRESGFTEEEVRVLVRKYPTLLGLSKDTLRQKLKFLVEEWKLPRNAILTNPVILCYSIEKRLKPRLNAVRALMMKNDSSKTAKSRTPTRYLKMSEGEFHREVVGRLAA